MPVLPSRRAAITGVTATLAGGAAGIGTAHAGPRTRIAAALALPPDTKSVALWGSSSMEGGLGEEHTPKPVFIHEELKLSFNPLPVYHVAYGAQASSHTTILRGLDLPVVHLPEGYDGGKVAVKVDTSAAPLWTFTCEGTLPGGERGILTGSKESTWYFESEGPAKSGEFTSVWKTKTAQSRHVLWTGKNNIRDIERVDSDVERLVAAARKPEDDVIVLGQWVTKKDLGRPDVIRNVHELNARHRARYGRRFIDVQAILTSEEALVSEPLWELGLNTREVTRAERAQGIVPDPLRGTDGVHLSGWGNLLVARALIERMKELRWL